MQRMERDSRDVTAANHCDIAALHIRFALAFFKSPIMSRMKIYDV
jgi:hypothetical protein